MKVGKRPYMQLWHGSWRYRRPIPKALQADIGRGAYWRRASAQVPTLRLVINGIGSMPNVAKLYRKPHRVM